MFRNILRCVVSLVFLASGFVKAVDVVGFSFKLEEYFSPSVFGLPFLEKFSLPIAVFVVAAELCTGIFLLLKIKTRATLNAMIALCIFFAFLTFYSAYFNKVTDCGCFGDAIKFSPWQSFFKDIALLVALFFLRLKFNENDKKPTFLKISVAIIFAFGMAFTVFWGISHEPLIDFRDYKIGKNILSEKIKTEKNPTVYKTFYLLKNTKNGKEISVNQDDYVNDKTYWQPGAPWQILQGREKSVAVKEGYSSETSKFKIETSDGEDLTFKTLTAPRAILVFCYKPDDADPEILAKTERILSREKGATVLGISTKKGTFKTIKEAEMDETAIKTIARSNPFVLFLHFGKITAKMSARDFLNSKN